MHDDRTVVPVIPSEPPEDLLGVLRGSCRAISVVLVRYLVSQRLYSDSRDRLNRWRKARGLPLREHLDEVPLGVVKTCSLNDGRRQSLAVGNYEFVRSRRHGNPFSSSAISSLVAFLYQSGFSASVSSVRYHSPVTSL